MPSRVFRIYAYLACLLPASILAGVAVALLNGAFGRAIRLAMCSAVRSAGRYSPRKFHE
jgi:hypothetical protein